MQWNKLEEASLRQTLASKFNIFSLSTWCSWQLVEAVWGCRNPGASPSGPARLRYICWTERRRAQKTRSTTNASDSTFVCPHPKPCNRRLAFRKLTSFNLSTFSYECWRAPNCPVLFIHTAWLVRRRRLIESTRFRWQLLLSTQKQIWRSWHSMWQADETGLSISQTGEGPQWLTTT